MSLSVSLYGGGVYGVYWGGVFTGLSGPQPRLTVGCRACLPVWGRGVWGVLGRGVYGALRPTAQTDCRMSPSVTLYGGGVYGVYWGGVFTGLSGPQPRQTLLDVVVRLPSRRRRRRRLPAFTRPPRPLLLLPPPQLARDLRLDPLGVGERGRRLAL